MYKETISTSLKLGERFNIAFPDGIPANSNIDKSKTALGMTHDEMLKERHSLMVISNRPIIESKCEDRKYKHIKPFAVVEGITPEMIANHLVLDNGYPYKKILVTPESFEKVIWAAISIGKLQWLYDMFLCFLDEAHCYAVDAFRKDILTPLKYIESFKSVAMGTATFFPYSHPRFKSLQKYKITYKETFGKVTIVDDQFPKTVLNYFLTHPELFPGHVFIFFNSVTGMGEAVNTAGITDVTIFCRDEEKNMINLEDASKFFKSKPVKEEFTKFNFFSCRYNEGWDLEDDETATMILFTDTTIPHSLVGIPYKGFQAVGRLRAEPHNKPHRIYHITNNFGKTGMNTLEHIQRTQLYNAQHHINQFNVHKASCKKNGYEDLEWLLPVIKPFANIDNEGIATLNEDLLDQISCADYCREMYNSVETIKEGWDMTNYETEQIRFNLQPLIRSKKSPEEINKQVLNHIKEIKIYPERYVYEVARETVNKYKVEFQLLIEAYEILGSTEIERLGYNNEAMKAALIETSNKNAEARLRLMMAQTFELNEPTTDKRYTNKYIKEKIQQFYDELGFKKSNGSPMVATAKHLQEYGMFEVRECKAEDEHGVKKPGFLIWKVNYSLNTAA